MKTHRKRRLQVLQAGGLGVGEGGCEIPAVS